MVDDVVSGLITIMEKGPRVSGASGNPHKVYNMGNNRPEELLHMIDVLEQAVGKTAKRKARAPCSPGTFRKPMRTLPKFKRITGLSPRLQSTMGCRDSFSGIGSNSAYRRRSRSNRLVFTQ